MKVLTFSLFIAAFEARKRLVDDHGHHLEQKPTVRGEECEQKCFFKNDLNSWCIETESPIVEIGWTYSQTYNSIDTL